MMISTFGRLKLMESSKSQKTQEETLSEEELKSPFTWKTTLLSSLNKIRLKHWSKDIRLSSTTPFIFTNRRKSPSKSQLKMSKKLKKKLRTAKMPRSLKKVMLTKTRKTTNQRLRLSLRLFGSTNWSTIRKPFGKETNPRLSQTNTTNSTNRSQRTMTTHYHTTISQLREKSSSSRLFSFQSTLHMIYSKTTTEDLHQSDFTWEECWSLKSLKSWCQDIWTSSEEWLTQTTCRFTCQESNCNNWRWSKSWARNSSGKPLKWSGN